MEVRVITYGERLGGSPKRREFYIIAKDEEDKPIEIKETIETIKSAIRMAEDWIIQTPVDKPWYYVIPCKYCVEAVRRRYKRMKTTFLDWYWSFCLRHATAEFVYEVDAIDNKKRVYYIDLEKGEIAIDVATCRHSAFYVITRNEINAELDNKVQFRYRAHVESWPYEPTYNRIVKRVIKLLSDLVDVLENPSQYLMNIYYNDKLIHMVK